MVTSKYTMSSQVIVLFVFNGKKKKNNNAKAFFIPSRDGDTEPCSY